MSKLTLTTEGDTHVIVKRHFTASPEAVYRAHIDPKIVQQSMPVPAARFAMSGATARARDSTSPANSSNCIRTAVSFT